MKPDYAHRQTDKIIEEMEKRISKEYKQAHKEIAAKAKDYFDRFKTKDETWQRWVAEGKKSAEEYQKWKTGQVLVGKRWNELRDSLAEDYANAGKIAQSVVNGYMPEVYALNHNYATFTVEKASMMDTSYTLYSRETVERLLRDNPKLYKQPGRDLAKKIAQGEVKRWEKQQIQSVMMQGILQGDSIPNLTKRLEDVTGGEHAAAIRNARTIATGVQNAGRIDAYERANEMGIETQKTWVATLDDRTRHTHRELDGQTVGVDEPFIVTDEDGTEYQIMFPGDPDADGGMVYNCRCTMISTIKRHEIDTNETRLTNDKALGGMTYEEWKKGHSKSQPITAQEEKGKAYKYKYIREYKEL